MPRQIGRAGNVDLRDLTDTTGLQAGIGQRPDTQSKVHPFAQQIDRAVCHAQLHPQTWPFRQKLRQGWRDDPSPDPSWKIDPDPAFDAAIGTAEHRFHLLALGKIAESTLIELLAFIGGRDHARRTVQKPRTQSSFQIGNGGRDAGPWHLQGIGCPREAAGLNDANEDAVTIKLIHCSTFATCDVKNWVFI